MKKVKKAIKINKKPDMHEAIRHFTVLLEDTNHEVKLISEQHEEINKKLDIHTEMIGELKVDVENIKVDVGVLKEDVGVLKQDVSVLKQDVGALKEDMVIVKNSLKQKVDVEDFSGLAKQVIQLKKKPA